MRSMQKRRWPRFLVDLFKDRTICTMQVNGEVVVEAGLRDISRRGAGLRNLSVYAGLEQGDLVLFRKISHDNDFAILLWRRGRVQWTNPETGDFGIAFEEPLPYAKMSRALLDALTEQGPDNGVHIAALQC